MALWYIMYCSEVRYVLGGASMGEGEEAVKVDGYDWDRKP